MKVFNRKNVIESIKNRYEPKSFEERYLIAYWFFKYPLSIAALAGSAYFSLEFWNDTKIGENELVAYLLTAFVSLAIYFSSIEALKAHIAYKDVTFFTILTVLLCVFNVITDIKGSKDLVYNTIEKPQDNKSGLLIQSFNSSKETLERRLNMFDSLTNRYSWASDVSTTGRHAKTREKYEENKAQRDSLNGVYSSLLVEHQNSLKESNQEHKENMSFYNAEIQEKTMRFTAGATICTIIFLSSFLFCAYYDSEVNNLIKKGLINVDNESHQTPPTTPPTIKKKRNILEVIKEGHDGVTSKKDIIYSFLNEYPNSRLEQITKECNCSSATAKKWRDRFFNNSIKKQNYA